VTIDTVGALSPCPADLSNAYDGLVGVALLELRSEVHHAETRRLLAIGFTQKIFLVPRKRASDIEDIQRMLHRHGGLA
jgi:predicted CDP-diglyceride synthetase/phosphatidate cytidylyltransferase